MAKPETDGKEGAQWYFGFGEVCLFWLWLQKLPPSSWSPSGLQLLAIGIIGEYIGKVYLETKQRPKFIVEEYLKDEDAEKKN